MSLTLHDGTRCVAGSMVTILSLLLQGIFDKQVAQLADLITIINGELTKNDRKKLITLCTIDVHARDVVQRLIEERVENQSCFQWQSQLRYYQNEKSKEAQVNICDAEIKYTYEYIGNCGCLCITPLTDRCYITLTQAQRLVLGGAPAGPAGETSLNVITLPTLTLTHVPASCKSHVVKLPCYLICQTL